MMKATPEMQALGIPYANQDLTPQQKKFFDELPVPQRAKHLLGLPITAKPVTCPVTLDTLWIGYAGDHFLPHLTAMDSEEKAVKQVRDWLQHFIKPKAENSL